MARTHYSFNYPAHCDKRFLTPEIEHRKIHYLTACTCLLGPVTTNCRHEQQLNYQSLPLCDAETGHLMYPHPLHHSDRMMMVIRSKFVFYSQSYTSMCQQVVPLEICHILHTSLQNISTAFTNATYQILSRTQQYADNTL